MAPCADGATQPLPYRLEIGREMQKLMTPHLLAMKKELKANWPQLEPELMLLHWLCERWKLDVPKVSLLRQRDRCDELPVSPEDLHQLAPLFGVAEGHNAVESRRQSTRSSAKRRDKSLSGTMDEARKLIDATSGMPGSNSEPKTAGVDSTQSTKPSTAASDPRLAKIDADVVSLVEQNDMLGTQRTQLLSGVAVEPFGEDFYADTPMASRVASFLQDRMRDRRVEMSGLGVRDVGKIEALVEEDAIGLETRHAMLRSNVDGIATQIAKMRQGLRGGFLAKVPLLSLKVLSREEQFWLVGKLRPWNFEAGEVIIAEQEVGDKLFIVERGSCEIWKTIDGKTTKIATIRKGDFFGELGVMYDMPRTATVHATTSVTVLSLCREDIFSTLSSEKIEKMRVLARAQVFSNIPLLSKLDSKNKVLLATSLKTDTWQPGSVLMRENQRVSETTRVLYIIERGQCTEAKMPGDSERGGTSDPRIPAQQRSVFMRNERIHDPGAFFGMLELLYGCPEQCTVTALTEVQTLSITFLQLQELLGDDVEETLELMRRSVRTHLVQQIHPHLRMSTHEELTYLLDSASTCHYNHWDFIFRKGEPLNHILMLEDGSVIEYEGDAESLVENTFPSAECIEHSRPGETFGTRFVIGRDQAVAPFTLVAISKCTMLHISKYSVESLPRFRGQLPRLTLRP